MNKEIKLFGVAGNPVMHSKSPDMFNRFFKEKGINARYLKIAASSPEDVMKLFNELNFTGINITAPFKNSMVPLVSNPDDDVIKTGSLNTIIKDKHKIYSYNTDHYGVTESLKKHRENLKGKRTLVIGAGGAGISAAYGLTKEGAHVTIINRTLEKAKNAATLTGAEYSSVDNLQKYLKESQITVITLPHEAGAVDISSMKKGSIIFDASYKNSFYKETAKNKGLTFIDGEEWLKNQAIPACEHFTGLRPDYSEMKISHSKENKIKEIISIIGFMGSGKTTVASLLAKSLGYKFIDTDAEIEKAASMSIEEIFTKKGEEAFRSMEKKILLSIKGKNKIVLSCGGGVILDKENREFLKTSTTCFWLYTSMENSIKRINDGSRPLLKTENPLLSARELFNKRKDLYAETCEIVLSSDHEPEKIAELINEEIRLSL